MSHANGMYINANWRRATCMQYANRLQVGGAQTRARFYADVMERSPHDKRRRMLRGGASGRRGMVRLPDCPWLARSTCASLCSRPSRLPSACRRCRPDPSLCTQP